MAAGFHYHFEWDFNKATQNTRKHGVTFEQAAAVFSDPLAVSILDDEHSETEERWITLGQANNGLLVVIHTYHEFREEEATIRVISARKATKQEQQQYEADR